METTDKSGKVKMTFEVEINPAAMELIKENMNNMVDMASQGMETWRSRSGSKEKQGEGGHGMGTMMHHGQE